MACLVFMWAGLHTTRGADKASITIAKWVTGKAKYGPAIVERNLKLKINARLGIAHL